MYEIQCQKWEYIHQGNKTASSQTNSATRATGKLSHQRNEPPPQKRTQQFTYIYFRNRALWRTVEKISVLKGVSKKSNITSWSVFKQSKHSYLFTRASDTSSCDPRDKGEAPTNGTWLATLLTTLR